MMFSDPTTLPYLVFFVMFGLVLGSFGNVLICRLPHHESIRGRSHCPRCKHTLSAWELIPLLSFLVLAGKCKKCSKPISWQYPLVEAMSGILFALAFLHEPTDPAAAFILALCIWLLLLMGVVDGQTGYLPDGLNLPFVALSIAYAAIHPPFDTSGVFLGGGMFLIQWLSSRGRWIGSGDVILGTGIGALLGSWEFVVLFLFLTYVSGGIVAGFLLWKGSKTLQSHLSFGPFLSASAIVCALWGGPILEFVKVYYLR